MREIYQLEHGKTYKTIKEYIDFDKITHKVGEIWTFDKIEFTPYYSGLSLFVIKDKENKMFRFQAAPEEQDELINNFLQYIEPLEI